MNHLKLNNMQVTPNPHTSHVGLLLIFLYGALFNILADMDYKSLVDYGLKAIVGGVVWLIFKMISDRLAKEKSPAKKSDDE
jgi:hypothetical protein